MSLMEHPYVRATAEQAAFQYHALYGQWCSGHELLYLNGMETSRREAWVCAMKRLLTDPEKPVGRRS